MIHSQSLCNKLYSKSVIWLFRKTSVSNFTVYGTLNCHCYWESLVSVELYYTILCIVDLKNRVAYKLYNYWNMKLIMYLSCKKFKVIIAQRLFLRWKIFHRFCRRCEITVLIKSSQIGENYDSHHRRKRLRKLRLLRTQMRW